VVSQLRLQLPDLVKVAREGRLCISELVLERDEGGSLLTVRSGKGSLGFCGRATELRWYEVGC
jgi:hypothetical protein